MSKKPTFLERLNSMYPGMFEIKRNEGCPPQDRAIIHSKNKRFGRIEIVGDFDEWRDDEDYFIEDEKGYYDDAETCGFWFYTRVGVYILSPSDFLYAGKNIF